VRFRAPDVVAVDPTSRGRPHLTAPCSPRLAARPVRSRAVTDTDVPPPPAEVLPPVLAAP